MADNKPQPSHPPELIWQDDAGCVVLKPAHMLVHNSRWAGLREISLAPIAGELAGQPVKAVHRLDRATSGLVLFAADPPGVQPWQQALADPRTAKVYLALVAGPLAVSSSVIKPVRDENDVYREARTTVAPLLVARDESCALVQLRLRTGRNHQARRHMRSIGYPIVGDTQHGRGPINRDFRARVGLRRLGLHAWWLAIDHPVTGERLNLRAPLPDDLSAAFAQLFNADALAHALAGPAALLDVD